VNQEELHHSLPTEARHRNAYAQRGGPILPRRRADGHACIFDPERVGDSIHARAPFENEHTRRGADHLQLRSRQAYTLRVGPKTVVALRSRLRSWLDEFASQRGAVRTAFEPNLCRCASLLAPEGPACRNGCSRIQVAR
jgi:hypothetical protein